MLLRTARPPAETEDASATVRSTRRSWRCSPASPASARGFRSGAAEVRDEVAAGSEEQRSTRLDLMVGHRAAWSS